MNDATIVLLLQLIKNNGSINNLIRRGYQYSQVALLLDEIIEEDYAYYNDDLIEITKKGYEKLRELSRKQKSNIWISPQEQYRINKIDRYDVFLPNKF